MRLFAIALGLALCVSQAAHAIWLSPDVVHIPTERLVTNLERSLATLPQEQRAATLLQLARLHSAAWAQKMDKTLVLNPTTMTIQPASVVGPHSDEEVRGALSYLAGQTGNPLESLRIQRQYDLRYGCDGRAVMNLGALSGQIKLRFELPARKTGTVAPQRVKVVTSTLEEKVVAACLVARITEEVRFPAKNKRSQVELTFEFTTAEAFSPFFGHGDYTVPSWVEPEAADAQLAELARGHLAKARARYEELVVLEPKNALAHLGLAWTLEQAGQLEAAVAAYRSAFREAWATESKLTHLGLHSRPIAAEAASLLKPRLDPKRDGKEIAELDRAVSYLASLNRPVTPIVVPLVDRATLADVLVAGSAVRFDLDGSGQPRMWGWVGPDAALLVWDPASSGSVTSGLQLFGSVSWWTFWRDGYEAMAALDDDGDGRLAGAELEGLALWRDHDGDGVSDPGEVQGVRRHGIVALATRATPVAGVLMAEDGVVFGDGVARPTWDWTPTSR